MRARPRGAGAAPFTPSFAELLLYMLRVEAGRGGQGGLGRTPLTMPPAALGCQAFPAPRVPRLPWLVRGFLS